MDNLHYGSDEEANEVEIDFPVDYKSDEEVNEVEARSPEKNYSLLKEEEIAKLQQDYISEVSTVLSISKSDACLLLPHFHWSVEDLQDEWFADEDKVRNRVGLLKKPVVEHSAGNLKITCGICFEEYNYSSGSNSTILTASCGHPYCRACWAGYIGTSISEGGPSCLMLRCPEPKCSAAIGPDLIQIVLVMSEKKERVLYDKYKRYLLRSYVENHRKIKWCPAPNCDYAIQFDALGRMVSYDVSCLCSHSYCWNCTEESHRPVDCRSVKNWLLKNKDDSYNGKWIIVNTKPCPKCNRSIEKNKGCNHMTCRAPCYHQFCWYCLGPFRSGCGCNGFYRMNSDKSDKGTWGAAEIDRRNAKRELERYSHYYERWENNGRSKQKALEDLEKVKTLHIKELGNLQNNAVEHVYSFIIEAWQQIIECRQVLRWTFVYGYYMSEEEEHAKREFFECLQGQAEYSLEQLHNCAESELQQFLVLANDVKDPKFIDFKNKLTGRTELTRNYFNKLTCALEEGLPEIKISSKTNKRKGLPDTEIESKTKKTKGFPETYSGYGTASSSSNTSHDYKDDTWSCQRCTYINPASTSRRCQMCNPGWSCRRCTYLNPASADSYEYYLKIDILPHFHWSVEDLQDEWFADEDKVREKAGLLKKPIVEHNASQDLTTTCEICFEEYYYSLDAPSRSNSILTASCGHPYCRDCWAGYISTSIGEGGPACLMLRCPQPKCSAAVGHDLIQKVLLTTNHGTAYDKYKCYQLRSYVENHRKIKWCPAPNCDYAVQFDAQVGMGSCDVSCLCSHSYCWNCTEENHI